MAYFTAAVLIDQVRSQLNWEDDDQLCTDAEILGYLNDEYEELWHAVAAEDSEFLATIISTTSAPSLGEYAALSGDYLPLSFLAGEGDPDTYVVWKHLSFELAIDDSPRYKTLRKISWQERVALGFGDGAKTGRPEYYSIFADRLYVHPKPNQAYGWRWSFVPVITRMVDDGSTEYNFYMGWQNFVVAGAAATCCAKEERDPSYYLAKKETWRGHVMTQIKPRDQGEPDRAIGAALGGSGLTEEDVWLLDLP